MLANSLCILGVFVLCHLHVIGMLEAASSMGKPTEENGLWLNNARLLVGQQLLVCLEGSETDGHLGHDAREDGTETLVETKRSLLLDDLRAGRNETSRLDLRCTLGAGVAMDRRL